MRKWFGRWMASIPWWMMGSVLALTVGIFSFAFYDAKHTASHAQHLEVLRRLNTTETDVLMASRLVTEMVWRQDGRARATLHHPRSIQAELQAYAREMPKHFSSFQQALQRAVPEKQLSTTDQWQFMEIQHRWLAVYQTVVEVAADPSKARSTGHLRAVSPANQAAFTRAVEEFLNTYHLRWARMETAARRRIYMEVLVACLLACTLLAGIYFYWIVPLRYLSTLDWQWSGTAENELPPYLRQTVWQDVWLYFHQIGARLRETEHFIRDLAMGRTPAPIPSEHPQDALGRSSYWLLQRWEQMQDELNQRQSA